MPGMLFAARRILSGYRKRSPHPTWPGYLHATIRRNHYAIILAVICLVTFNPGRLHALTTSTARLVDPAGASQGCIASNPSAAADPSGYCVVAWETNTSGPVYAISVDHGRTWSSPSTAPAGAVSNPRLACSSAGTFIMHYHTASGLGITRSTNHGTSWSTPVSLPGVVDSCRVGNAGAGHWVAVWHEPSALSTLCSSDDGLTWTTGPTAMERTTYCVGFPADQVLACSSTGTCIVQNTVTIMYTSPMGHQVFYPGIQTSHSSDRGLTWNQSAVDGSVYNTLICPAIETNQQGKWIAQYQLNGWTHSRISSDDGSTWSSGGGFSAASDNLVDPVLNVNSGTWLMACRKGSASYVGSFCLSRDDGATWSPLYVLTGMSLDSGAACVAAGPGEFLVFWTSSGTLYCATISPEALASPEWAIYD